MPWSCGSRVTGSDRSHQPGGRTSCHINTRSYHTNKCVLPESFIYIQFYTWRLSLLLNSDPIAFASHKWPHTFLGTETDLGGFIHQLHFLTLKNLELHSLI